MLFVSCESSVVFSLLLRSCDVSSGAKVKERGWIWCFWWMTIFTTYREQISDRAKQIKYGMTMQMMYNGRCMMISPRLNGGHSKACSLFVFAAMVITMPSNLGRQASAQTSFVRHHHVVVEREPDGQEPIELDQKCCSEDPHGGEPHHDQLRTVVFVANPVDYHVSDGGNQVQGG